MKRYIGWVGNGVIAVLLVAMAVLVFFSVGSKISSDGMPKFVNYKLMVVLSGSMSPVFEAGDAIIVKFVDIPLIKTGDIITFKDPADAKRIVTHRVIEIQNKKNLAFKTKGDANSLQDNLPVPAGNVIGKMKFSIPYFGHTVEFAKTKKGLVWLIIVPGVLVILGELRHIAKTMAEKEKNNEEVARSG
jgi:signal peptidase